MHDLTAARLRELVSYDADAGLFTSLRSGKCVGHRTRENYVRLELDGRRYLAHRLAWLYSYGEWPTDQIDHINGTRNDNRLANLRNVSSRVNAENRRKPLSKTGFLGVARNGSGFQATLDVGPKRYRLGTYPTPEEAHAVYLKAKRELHEGCSL